MSIMNITPNTVIAADLDGTLAESKLPIRADMAQAISTWLSTNRFAVISGGAYERFHTQVVEMLPVGTNLANLYLFPTNGATCFNYMNGEWKEIYKNLLTEEEGVKIFSAFETVLRDTSIADIADEMKKNQHGQQLEFRGGQVTLSALGQQAPIELKAPWDPDQNKRKKITALLIPLLPEFYVAIAGATSVDVTHKGIDKEYAVKKMVELLSIPEEEIIFFGDAIFEGGNDFAVTRTKATTIKVSDPEETRLQLIDFVSKVS